jgi:predicted ABC-type exoprotein transport system permease subunit
VFDFHHVELVLSSSVITIKPITIKEDYFKFLIPSKTKLKDFVNDPIIVSFRLVSHPSALTALVTTPLLVVAARGQRASNAVEQN